MAQTIEIEVRGPLEKEQYTQLVSRLETEGTFKKARERVLIDYSTYLPNEGIRERTKDIRLRITNGKPEIIVKVGSWGGSDQRREISVMTPEGTFDSLVEIFGIIGLQKGTLCVRNSRVYDYQGVEFALIEVPGHSYFFEAEKMIEPDADRNAAQDEIRAVCTSLGLTLFTDDTFFAYIDRLNKEANGVFDFSQYHEGDFQKQYGFKGAA